MSTLKHSRNRFYSYGKSSILTMVLCFALLSLSSFQWGSPLAEIKNLADSQSQVHKSSAAENGVLPSENEASETAERKKDPEFPGGVGEMVKFIQKNFKLPAFSYLAPKGTIYVRFDVTPEGELTNVAIKKGLTEELNQEAVRLVKTMPKWIPGNLNGKQATLGVVIPIKIQFL